ncbi:type II toxin-antitoxin system VapC family toxin [Parasediminibacterium sp. JCM 36343]|uniref:type II toxin-antitoxin system VapC family toxin n=1 Tax=Parasediminibacterium sp. JCM 36343 TaxID=3374279 RepID=UPI00397B1F05
MGKYLMDNNAISHFFSGTYTESGLDFISNIIDDIPNISVITQIEALSWIQADKKKERIIAEFIADAHVFILTNEIVEKCIAIRRSKKIKTPDAIIAATAIEHNLTLVSSDKGFDNIKDLVVIDPNSF